MPAEQDRWISRLGSRATSTSHFSPPPQALLPVK